MFVSGRERKESDWRRQHERLWGQECREGEDGASGEDMDGEEEEEEECYLASDAQDSVWVDRKKEWERRRRQRE